MFLLISGGDFQLCKRFFFHLFIQHFSYVQFLKTSVLLSHRREIAKKRYTVDSIIIICNSFFENFLLVEVEKDFFVRQSLENCFFTD